MVSRSRAASPLLEFTKVSKDALLRKAGIFARVEREILLTLLSYLGGNIYIHTKDGIAFTHNKIIRLGNVVY